MMEDTVAGGVGSEGGEPSETVGRAWDALVEAQDAENATVVAPDEGGMEAAVLHHARKELLDLAVKSVKAVLEGDDKERAEKIAVQLVRHLVPKGGMVKDTPTSGMKRVRVVLSDGRSIRRDRRGRPKLVRGTGDGEGVSPSVQAGPGTVGVA